MVPAWRQAGLCCIFLVFFVVLCVRCGTLVEIFLEHKGHKEPQRTQSSALLSKKNCPKI